MTWEKYKSHFTNEAMSAGYDEAYINKNLKKAYRLFIQGLPIIYDQFHLSHLLGYSSEYLLKVSNSNTKKAFYRFFKIKKKNGGLRNLAEPLPNLKNIQKWILEEILYKCETSAFSKAYKKNFSLYENVKFHRKQKKVLSIDIKDFFHSIKYIKVYFFFYNLGYSKGVATMLTNLCTLNESLPQGAPTSPALSNLIMKDIDNRISAFCKIDKIRYTRYADDLTFSGDFEEGKQLKFVERVLKSNGFQLNHAKTRVRLQHQRQEVTGIIVNEKIQVSREVRRELRKNIYFINKYGIDSHILVKNQEKIKYLKHLLGVANNICNVNPKDEEVLKYLRFIKELWHQEN